MFTHRAYAKINLGLRIIEKRKDGYHNIETVFHRINLFDEITLEPSTTIDVHSSGREIPQGDQNISFRAAKLVQDHLNIPKGVRITISKNIPVGAGLGGGSADAAVILSELPKLWGHVVPESVLLSMAAEIGSDVPYFLRTGSALARGRGEILEYFDLDVPFNILLCSPNIHISTAWAYQNIEPSSTTKVDLRGLVVDGMRKPLNLVNGLRNDFEPLIFRIYPEVMRVKESMMRGGAEFALMSGSGSSVFGFFSEKHFAEDVAAHLQRSRYQTFLTAPHFRVSA